MGTAETRDYETTKSEVIENLVEQLDDIILYIGDCEVYYPDLAITRRLAEELRDETESLLED